MLSSSGGCQLCEQSPGDVTFTASGGDTDPKHQIPNAIALETRSWAPGFPAHVGVHSLPMAWVGGSTLGPPPRATHSPRQPLHVARGTLAAPCPVTPLHPSAPTAAARGYLQLCMGILSTAINPSPVPNLPVLPGLTLTSLWDRQTQVGAGALLPTAQRCGAVLSLLLLRPFCTAVSCTDVLFIHSIP